MKKNDLLKFICSVILLSISCCLLINNKKDIDNMLVSAIPIQVVYVTDNNYVNYMRASIRSIVANKNKATKIKIYVLADDLSEKNIKKIQNEKAKNVEISIIPVSTKYLETFQSDAKSNPDVTRADNAKFFLSTILKDVRKVIYLDGDTIILKDLSILYYKSIGNKYVGAVDDWQTKSSNGRYFNNGVMLLNLEKMRQDNVQQKLLTYKKNDKIKRFMTQDAFNSVMKGKVEYLPLYYNTFAPEFDSEYLILSRMKQVLNKNLDMNLYPALNSKYYLDKVVVIHYCGFYNLKPWHKIDFKRRTNRIFYRYAPFDFWVDCMKGKCKMPDSWFPDKK